MIVPLPATDEPPRIVAPAPSEVSFGRIVATLPRGTRRVVLLVDGKAVARRTSAKRRVTIRYRLPRRDVTLRLLAIKRDGSRSRSRPVGPVLGLPPPAAPRPTRGRQNAALSRALNEHVRAFPGVSAFYVRDLVGGEGSAWNAMARFPAGSTLKVALVLEALRVTNGPLPAASPIRKLIEGTIVDSSNLDANALATAIAGSTSSASARTNALMSRIGLTDSDMYGGYLIEDEEQRARGLAGASGLPRGRPRTPPPIPIESRDQPQFKLGKQTSAADLGKLFSAIHLAAGGRGPLIKHFPGEITPAEARHLLFTLTHTREHGVKLADQIPGATVAHKAGWISTARHDAGIVYWKGGAFVVAAMTWNAAGVGTASDLFAARIARTGLTTFRG